MSEQVSVGIEDKEILHSFIQEAEPLLSKREEAKETLSDIFRRAAIELEKYYDDTTMICARLSRIWKDEARLVRKALDDKYKRAYGPDNETDIPITQIEELFLTLKESLEGLLKVNNRILDKVTVPIPIKKKLQNETRFI